MAKSTLPFYRFSDVSMARKRIVTLTKEEQGDEEVKRLLRELDARKEELRKPHVYGYARVSTLGQARDGNSLDSQELALLKEGAEEVFKEAISGAVSASDRPVFSALEKKLRKGDTLLVTKLDRLARSLVGGVTLCESLRERGVIIRILNLGTLDHTATGDLLLRVFLAFAEFERALIKERMAEGRAIAKAKKGKDYREGRPKKFTENAKKEAMEQLFVRQKSYREVSDDLRISVSTLVRWAREYKLRNATL